MTCLDVQKEQIRLNIHASLANEDLQ